MLEAQTDESFPSATREIHFLLRPSVPDWLPEDDLAQALLERRDPSTSERAVES